jgi:RNA polymerase sigma-70 factor (sigma-E family)
MPRTPSDIEFAELVEAAWSGLYRTAYLMLGDHQLAEDLVQTALAKTYASWSKVRDVDAAPGYARVVLANTAASWFRRRSWRNEHPTAVLPEEVMESDGTDRPAVMDALRTLPPRMRAVIVLRYFDDLDVRSVADALGISEGTVKSQTSHALGRLRVALGDAVVPLQQGAHHD